MENRRSHPRYPVWTPSVVVWEGNDERFPAVIWDLSEGGAAVEVTDTRPGRIIQVLLNGGGIPQFLPMRLIKANPGTIRGVLLHARFLPLSEQSRRFLDQAIAGWRDLHEERQAWLASRANDLRRAS
jgi:hypothetical protein